MKLRIVAYTAGLSILAAAVLWAASHEIEPIRDTTRVEMAGVEPWICPRGTVGRVSCAFVEVPENYDDPEIRSVKLFTARVQPPGDPAGPPLVFIGSGLGRAAVGDFGDWQRVSRQLEREIVLVDLRGTGRSEPRLACTELTGNDWLEADLIDQQRVEAELSRLADSVARCHQRLASTVALEAYSLDAHARDLDVVRGRFGHDSWVISAGGDAALVARRAEALAGDHVASLVLLGAVRTSAGRHVGRYVYAQEVLDLALGSELSLQLDAASEELAERSLVFTIQASRGSRRVLVSDEVVKPTLARAVADPDFRVTLDGLIGDRLSAGQWRNIAALRDQQQRELSTRALPVSLGVLCGDPSLADAERWWDDEAVDFDAAWTGLLDDPTLDPALCVEWDVEAHAEVAADPSTPTLVINGELDVNAPRSATEEIAGAWAAATTVTLAGVGRPSPFGECTINLVQAFLSSTEPQLAQTELDGVCS